MKKLSLIVLLATVANGFFYNSYGQDIDAKLSEYADSLPQEKLHLHFDKDYYRKGENIWYKAYLLADMQPSAQSKNFYTDWYDNEGKLLAHAVTPFYRSTAKGQFELPENYKGGFVHIRAYTKWMLNFDSAFIYDKYIPIDQTNLQESSANKKETLVKKGLPTNADKTQATAERNVTSMRFFPEGGDWVVGIESRIAFLAANQYGKPVNAVGAIIDSKGEFIDSFASTHDGMGFLELTPQADNPLTAIWFDNWGYKNFTPLPLPRPSGITLQAQPTGNKVVFIVRCSKGFASENWAHVLAYINQREVYKSKVNLTRGAARGEIPTVDLPTGILHITVFDGNWKPMAERVLFINNELPVFKPSINVGEIGLNQREKNVLEITVDDSVRSNMSISITDADWKHDSSNNIVSQFLLSGDVRGYIYKPAYYFSNNTDSIKQQLGLVMMTHGWRRFNWEEVAKGEIPKLAYGKDSDYLEIKGKVFGRSFKRHRPDQTINLILQTKDSSRQLISLPISKNGDFVQKGALFFDTVSAYYQFNGEKRLTDVANVKFSNGLFTDYPKKVPTNEYQLFAMPNFAADTINLLTAKTLLEKITRAEKRMKAHLLEEVTVRTKVKKNVDKLDEKYTTGFFSGGDAYQFDLTQDPIAQSYPDIFMYLQGRIAGLQISEEGITQSLRWRGATPELYLDEIKVTTMELRTVTMQEIAYIKVFRPPFFGSFGSGEGGAIAIYTRKGGDIQFISGQGMGLEKIVGYTKYKEFYNPDYSYNQSVETDIRTTLYWNPYLLTDPTNKTIKVEFYNNDISKRLRVILEGIDSEGRLTRVEKIIE